MSFQNSQKKQLDIERIRSLQLKQLQDGLTALKINLSEQQQDKLIAYLGLLTKWNRAFNLTAITDPKKMVAYHLLDSLSIYPFVTQQRVIDVGTGAGLPGIPLAIAAPENQVYLLDSNSKKTRFLQQVRAELNIENTNVIDERVERFEPEDNLLFGHVISRAFTSLAQMVGLTLHLCAKEGSFLAMKGKIQEEEFKEFKDIQNSDTIIRIERIDVPGLDAERHLIIVPAQTISRSKGEKKSG